MYYGEYVKQVQELLKLMDLHIEKIDWLMFILRPKSKKHKAKDSVQILERVNSFMLNNAHNKASEAWSKISLWLDEEILVEYISQNVDIDLNFEEVKTWTVTFDDNNK